MEPAEKVAVALSRCLNALGLLAAPRAWAAANPGGEALRAGIAESLRAAHEAVGALDEVVETVTGPFDRERLLGLLGQLEHEASRWTAGPPPEPMVDLARRALAEMSIPEPEGGWERFEPDPA